MAAVDGRAGNPARFGTGATLDRLCHSSRPHRPQQPNQPNTKYVVSCCPATVTAGKTIKSLTRPNKPALHISSVNAS